MVTSFLSTVQIIGTSSNLFVSIILQISFRNQISQMMYGFGDSHKPSPDTVHLVEHTVLSQLRTIIQEALKHSAEPNKLQGEELVFLMRKNKHKMRRFIKYLQNKEMKRKFEKQLDETGPLATEQMGPSARSLIEFIEHIDETGELTDMAEFDDMKYERQLRADRISQMLDTKKYIEFCQARHASFTSKNPDELRFWLDPDQELSFTSSALDILAYYAFETVAQIVDYALLVRMDRQRTKDPFSSLAGMHYNAVMFNGSYRFVDSKPDISVVYTGQPPISVDEIREVMRRVTMPQAGRLYLGKKLPETQFLFAL